jgi:hypothetical protein
MLMAWSSAQTLHGSLVQHLAAILSARATVRS